MLLRMRSQTLMVRSAASRVSNHETRGFILRDASLRDAPQDKVSFMDEVPDPHGEERVFACLEP
jgi:hypothetical protein